MDLEGNAILNLGNNAEEATTKLNELIKTHQKLLAEETEEKLVDVFHGIYEDTRKANNDIVSKKNEANDFGRFLISDLQSIDTGSISLFGNYSPSINTQALMTDVAAIISDAN